MTSRKMNDPSRSSIDLFAGAGGLSVGLENAGFRVSFANEVSGNYGETLRQNHPDSSIEIGDIREISAVDVRRQIGVSKKDLDLLVGGPPCQGFSINAPVRSAKDERNRCRCSCPNPSPGRSRSKTPLWARALNPRSMARRQAKRLFRENRNNDE